jgi:hypothetical protein
MMSDSLPPREPVLRGDRAYTFRVTFICLAVGVIIAAVVALILLSLRQPLTTNPNGSVVWTLGVFMVPAAGLASITILAWSVFYLPLALARRQRVVLDPQVWPMTGAVVIGILVIVGFMAAILLGLI